MASGRAHSYGDENSQATSRLRLTPGRPRPGYSGARARVGLWVRVRVSDAFASLLLLELGNRRLYLGGDIGRALAGA